MAKATKSDRSKDLKRIQTVSADQAESIRGGDKPVVHKVKGKSSAEFLQVTMKEVLITS